MKISTFIILLLALSLSADIEAQTDRHREEALMFLEKGEVAEAKEKMEAALKIAPEIAENHFLMGRVKIAMRNSQEALKEFAIDDSLKLATSDLFLYQGIANYFSGYSDAALESYGKAIKLNDRDYKIFYNRALLYIDQEKYDNAMTDLNTAIDLKSDVAEAYLQRAIISFENEKFKNCISDCDNALKIKPEMADAYYYRAMGNGSSGNDDKAINDFSKAIELNPNHDNALSRRGSAKFLSGNKKGACIDWEKARDLGNEEADNNYISYCE
jgi:tetratricopeptide (TPR) repeat protein